MSLFLFVDLDAPSLLERQQRRVRARGSKNVGKRRTWHWVMWYTDHHARYNPNNNNNGRACEKRKDLGLAGACKTAPCISVQTSLQIPALANAAAAGWEINYSTRAVGHGVGQIVPWFRKCV